MTGRLDGKVIAFTGAGRGLGRHCALLAAAEGARVVVNDLGGASDGAGGDVAAAESVVREIVDNGGQAVANVADVSTMAGGRSVVDTAVDAWGGLNGVVTLAAIMRNGFFCDMTEEQWDDVMRVNVKGTFTVLRAAAPILREQGHGAIVTFCSGSGPYITAPGFSNYGTSKGAVAALTNSLSEELGPYGVTVNSISPRAATRLFDVVVKERSEKFVFDPKVTRAGVPNVPRWDPAMVAPMTVYLLSDEAREINGCFFEVREGYIGRLAGMVGALAAIETDGGWTLDELSSSVPNNLMASAENR